MLTDERIENMAYEYCEGADELEYRDLIDFARKILAEVKLQDLLKAEEEFIFKHTESFLKHVGAEEDVELGGIYFCKANVYWAEEGHEFCECIGMDEYNQWKQQLGLDELTGQAQEVKR